MPKITPKLTSTSRLSNPEIEAKGKAAAEKAAGGKQTTAEKIRNQFTPGIVDARAAERLNPSTGTPTPSRIADIYAKNAPSSLSYLDRQGGFLPARLPTKAELEGAPKVTFGRHGGPDAQEIKAGGKLVIEYDANRSPMQESLGSVPAWGVTAFIEFQPGGQRVEAPAVGFQSYTGGRISPQPFTVPIAVDVPAGTTGVSMWFHQFQGASHPAEAWDSNYGRNYQLAVKS